jgi:hypothetical protein
MALPPPPAHCPSCAARLTVSGLHCDECGTGITGQFRQCAFCALDDAQLTLLRVFLAARGNAKELERHLGVSYPTARARLDSLLAVLGINTPPPDAPNRRDILAAVASGELDVDAALGQLDRRNRQK